MVDKQVEIVVDFGSVGPEKLQNLGVEDWISVIKKRWENIPELKIDSGDLSHLAVICDGNRRSAKEKGLDPFHGHRLGLEVVRGVMLAAKEWKIKHLTFWAWSTENWKRDREQVGFVMNLAAKYLRDEEAIAPILKNEVRFRQIGRLDRLPNAVREAIIDLEERTSHFDKYFVNLALDYGGEDELSRAVARMIEEGLTPEEVAQNPKIIYNYLDTAGQPLPDLVIRTGTHEGEIPHTSGFMPLQIAYSGWAFIPDLFPDLSPESLAGTIRNFLGYERRMGK